MAQGKVLVLDITFRKEGGEGVIHPVILDDDENRVLVDCGYPGFLPQLDEAAHAHGISLDRLTGIVVTHHDFDHMGSLAALKKAHPRARVMASTEEAPYISGKKKSLRLQQAEALFDSLPQSEREAAESFQRRLASVETVDVDAMLWDHDRFPWCGGTEILATPGHMPGHISVYVAAHKTLITGDAMVMEDGELHHANPHYTLDRTEARRSVEKLLDYDIERIVCYHGGVFEGDVRGTLQRLLDR